MLIASGADVVVDQPLPVPPPADTTRFSSLPDLLPLAAHLPPPVPHVVVVTDTSGADLHSFDGQVELVETVRGRQHPLHKVGGGGWAHKRLQQRVEDTVKHNAKQVAEEVERLVGEVQAELAVLGGEVQTRSASSATSCAHLSRSDSSNTTPRSSNGSAPNSAATDSLSKASPG